jgi:transcriptional regulator with XRE-family HTH domain
MYKRMLGDTIYRLRKEKGMSQSELGELVGVSNKAVSKWETYEANPDITLLPLLAQTLGVSTDELLTDIKAEKSDLKPKEAKVFGMDGMVIETSEEYEFISDKKTKNEMPYLHIHIGKQVSTLNAKARGVIAIGNNAKGIISIGFISVGLVSLGLVPIGLLALGVFAIGLVSIGAFAFGGITCGAIAIGVVSIGAIAIGYLSYGAVSIGHYAHTITNGYASGKLIFFH